MGILATIDVNTTLNMVLLVQKNINVIHLLLICFVINYNTYDMFSKLCL